MSFATIDDLDARYPNELTLIAADEQTGLRDSTRIELGLKDASNEVRAILAARYSTADLSALDEPSADIVSVYTMDIAMYRIALAFTRSSENIKERYDQAIKRLEAIASGKGALTVINSAAGSGSGAGNPSDDVTSTVGQNEVVLIAPERMFTRQRLGSI
jgi:phage gp36-like protein